ncbi:tripeptidyl-peptidase II Tpp2, partial [Cladochytrium tenue]
GDSRAEILPTVAAVKQTDGTVLADINVAANKADLSQHYKQSAHELHKAAEYKPTASEIAAEKAKLTVEDEYQGFRTKLLLMYLSTNALLFLVAAVYIDNADAYLMILLFSIAGIQAVKLLGAALFAVGRLFMVLGSGFSGGRQGRTADDSRDPSEGSIYKKLNQSSAPNAMIPNDPSGYQYLPTGSLNVENETQAAEFLKAHPEYDGRGTVIAILDTGVDPGAVGIRHTTTGEPKCIHLIDCTGAGDVPCHTVVEATADPTREGVLLVTGLTGRELRIPSSWPRARDGKYRLGWKAAARLFPDSVLDELKADRRKKFQVDHDRLLTEAEEKLRRLNIGGGKSDGGKDEEEDLKRQIEVLKEELKNYDDPGPIFNEIGRVVELLRDEAVNKAGCIVLSSAGNSGPVLSSVSHPGGISGIITVGAFQSAVMQDALYMLLENVPDRPTTWSSQGPSPDGHYGVDIYVSGLTALLVSGLKQEFLVFNPYRVARALRNSAKSIGDPFGVGLAQVERAWGHLTTFKSPNTSLDVLFKVKVSGNIPKRGIYLRELEETSSVQRKTVSVAPVFFKSDDISTNPLRQQFETHVVLKSTAPWIKSPEFAILANAGREFLVEVDPTQLPSGFHYGEVQGFDLKLKDSGPLFKIPVTVCKPDITEPSNVGSDVVLRYQNLKFGPGTIIRKFFTVPPGANFAEIVIRSKERIGSGRVFVNVMQLRNHSMTTTYEQSWVPSFSSTTSGLKDDEAYFKKVFPVLSGITGELVFGQLWNSIGDTQLSVDIIFHGLEVSASGDPNGGFGNNTSGDQIILNSGNDKVKKAIRPTSAEIQPLPPQYSEPDSKRMRELILNYTIKLNEDATITPVIPFVEGILYDSIFNHYLLQVFDAQKALKSVHDVKASSTKLTKGTYTIKAQLISVNEDLLEGLKTTPLSVDIQLAKPVSLSLHTSLGDMLSRGGKPKSVTLERGELTTFWISPAEGSTIPKSASPGDLLLGALELSAEPNKIKLHKVTYIVPTETKEAEKKTAPVVPGDQSKPSQATEVEKSDLQKLKESVRDLEISHLKKVKNVEEREQLITRLLAESPTHLPLMVAVLEVRGESLNAAEDALDEKKNKADGDKAEAEKFDEKLISDLLAAADAVLGLVDRNELSMYYGAKTAEDSLEVGGDAAKKLKEERDKQKAAVQAALAWRARGLRRQQLASSVAKDDEGARQEFDSALNQLAAWLPSPATSDGRYLELFVWRQQRLGRLGAALQLVSRHLADADVRAGLGAGDEAASAAALRSWRRLAAVKRDLLRELGWEVWRGYDERWRVAREPPSFAPF